MNGVASRPWLCLAGKSHGKNNAEKLHDFFVKRLHDFFLNIVHPVTAVSTVNQKLSQYFWKDQFDTFCNQCDVLRAAFCNSCDVFLRGCMILFVKRLHDFCVWRGCVIFLTCSLRLNDLFFWRLHDIFCGKVA